MYWTTHLVNERLHRQQANAFRARLLATRHDADDDASTPDKKDEREPAPKPTKRRLLRGSWFPGRAITVQA
jgi:hypothetical protein